MEVPDVHAEAFADGLFVIQAEVGLEAAHRRRLDPEVARHSVGPLVRKRHEDSFTRGHVWLHAEVIVYRHPAWGAIMRTLCLLLVFLPIPCLAADQPVVLPLFDFENGIPGWLANPWSGGKGFVEASPDAKFGKGALRVRYENIPQACNMICPYFADDAPWRDGDYDALCFWMKGDGTPSYVTVILEAEVGGKVLTFSGQAALSSKQWRRFCLKFDTLWNREDQSFNLKTFKRLYFGTGGTHEAVIDQIELQRTLRAVPVLPVDNGGPAALTPLLYADRTQQYFLSFDPQTVLEPTVSATLTVQWPEKKAKDLMRNIATQAATEETWLPLPSAPDADGTGRLGLKLTEPTGTLCYAGQFSFPVAMGAPRLPVSNLQIIPQPKLMLQHPTKLKVPGEMSAYIVSQPKMAQVGLERIKGDMAAQCGCRVSYNHKAMQDLKPAVLIIAPNYERPQLPEEVTDRLGMLRADGYVLYADRSEIVLAALDEDGMRNGAITLKQAVQSASPSAEETVVPGMTVVDWPSLSIRAVNIGLPTSRWGYPNDAPVSVDFFIDHLQRTVVDQKINMVGLEVAQGMKFDRHPEIAGPAAWSKADVRRIVDFLKGNGVEVFPLVNSLGHANWLTIPLPQFREDVDEHQLCTRHPDVRKVLEDVYDECVEVFSPRYFHFGLDEIRWQTLDLPPEKRCPRCAGLDKRDLFVEHVKWLDGYARSHNLQMMMWADMILPEHNGGPPFQLADTIDKLPGDIVMCDWSATLAPLSLWDLQRRGFTVWKCNSRGANSGDLPFIAGNMWGIWTKSPWLTESCWPAIGYAYPNQLVAAEYGWNPYPDMMANGVPLTGEWLAQRALAQRRVAMPLAANTGATVDSVEPVDTPLKLAGMTLRPWAKGVDAEKSFAVGRAASVVYALVAAELPAEARKGFLDEFKKAANWQGVPIGQVVLKYADGTEAALPILYGYHVRAVAPEEEFPQAYGAMATTTMGEAKQMAYLVALMNPSPEQAVAEVRFAPGTLGARPVLWGLATRSVWRPN